MIRVLAAAAALAVPTFAFATPPVTRMPARVLEGPPAAALAWRAPNRVPVDLVSLPAPSQEKIAAGTSNVPGQPLKVATNQSLDNAIAVPHWSAAAGGFVAKVRVTSAEAAGIRTRLELGTVPGPIEVRVQGSDRSVLEFLSIDPTLGNTHWTPWTEGPSQVIELYSAVMPSPGAVSVSTIGHFSDSPLTAKTAAAICTVSAQCSTGNDVLDSAIAQARNSVAKIVFATAEGQFLCTATLLNSASFPAPFLATAHHCIGDSNAAATLTTFWFYQTASCDDLGALQATQAAGGSQLVFTDYNADSTLLRMNRNPPAGVTYSAWNKAQVPATTAFVSLSHPRGDAMRLAQGTVAAAPNNLLRIDDHPYDMYAVNFTQGIIEGGSSGSGLFVLDNGVLELRGVLTGSTIRNDPGGLSCTDLTEYGLYDRFEVFEPEIDQYLAGAPRTDDAPNRVQDLSGMPIADPNGVDKPLDQRTSSLVLSRSIDYSGDIDVFRFSIAAPSTVHVFTTGGLDTVGQLMDSFGAHIASNDDESAASTNMGITQSLDPGTYYVAVGAWDPSVTGAYAINFSATPSTAGPTNYTDLWWNSAESGWGLNVNDQGTTLFATLFTYDASGAPMWLVLANGALQSDGSFTGPLYRTTGSPFNAVPFGPSTPAQVGTMTLRFATAGAGTLSYTVNGTSVTKQITRQPFSTPATCTFTTGDRSAATNYQDLWWNPSEPGWGVNVTHQGDILFATLFDYDLNGQGTWYVLANAPKTAPGVYSGALYRVTGPVFNANPWTPTTPTQVGTMTFSFSSGNAGTLTYTVNGIQVTKSIQREVFSSPTTQCQ
jgi:lysyl endopeptidase